jgi:ATP-dependent DNA helicase RecG
MYAAEVDRALTDDDVVARLAELPEGQWYERKSGRIKARDLAVPLVALANAEGGTVVVGLHAGQPDGLTSQRVNELRQAAHDFTRPVVRARTQEILTPDGHTLLAIRVEPGEHVHETASGDCYLRVGDESRKLGFAQRQELEFDRGSAPYDGTPLDVGPRDLDEAQVQGYADLIGSSDAEAMLNARSLATRDGRLTVAAYLLFAARPQDVLPHAHVRVLRYAETDRGTGAGLTLEDDADIRCEGSIPVQIEHAAEVIERLVPRRRALAASGRFESRPIVPRDAWLEGVVNAVLHRSYSSVGDHVRVEIFPDRVEISSPGRFPGLVNPADPLSISRHARNPRIARVCADLGIAQELGEGIRRIFAQMRERGLTDPMYVQTGGSVRLVLAAADAIPEEIRSRLPTGARVVLDTLRRAGRPLGTGQVEDLVGMTRPTVLRHLNGLRDEGLVHWEGMSARDPRATWRVV